MLPVTGRPAGWCDMIARFWPVCGVVGENGGFYFRYDGVKKKMIRRYVFPEKTQIANQRKLEKLGKTILKKVSGAAISADQFSRKMDLAIDFSEDVKPLSSKKVLKIQSLFEQAGAQAKISSIHVNGWFGEYSKLSQSLEFLKKEMGLNLEQIKSSCAFIGDSPNDEPMWGYFPNSVAVANILDFKDQVKNWPEYVTRKSGGEGFVEFAKILIKTKN